MSVENPEATTALAPAEGQKPLLIMWISSNVLTSSTIVMIVNVMPCDTTYTQIHLTGKMNKCRCEAASDVTRKMLNLVTGIEQN